MPKWRHAFVVGKFAPPHRGHQRLIEEALAVAGRVSVVVWANPDFDFAKSETRASWIREMYPEVEVVVPENAPHDSESDDVQRAFCAKLARGLGWDIDVVVSGEYYGEGLARVMGAESWWIDRSELDVSGTAVRSNWAGESGKLSKVVQRGLERVSAERRLVLMGAESTGKSSLGKRLGEELGGFVHEVGREVYESLGGELVLSDYTEIARLHRSREDDELAKLGEGAMLVSDTCALTTMMFSHLYEGDSEDELREMAGLCDARYGWWVLCDDDIPFDQDGWRDSEEWRGRMQGIITADLATRGIEYVTVSGSIEERVSKVKAFLAGEIRAGTHPGKAEAGRGPRGKVLTGEW